MERVHRDCRANTCVKTQTETTAEGSCTPHTRSKVPRFDFALAAVQRRAGKPARQWERFPVIPKEFLIGKTTAYALIKAGILPKPYPVGKRNKRWDRDELDIAHDLLRKRQISKGDGGPVR